MKEEKLKKKKRKMISKIIHHIIKSIFDFMEFNGVEDNMIVQKMVNVILWL